MPFGGSLPASLLRNLKVKPVLPVTRQRRPVGRIQNSLWQCEDENFNEKQHIPPTDLVVDVLDMVERIGTQEKVEGRKKEGTITSKTSPGGLKRTVGTVEYPPARITAKKGAKKEQPHNRSGVRAVWASP
jgi:hypothetical protein